MKAFTADTHTPVKAVQPNKSQVTSLLPLQRAQNIGERCLKRLQPNAHMTVAAIMLARLRMENTAIRDAVLRVDDRKLTIDRLKPLKTFVPTMQEVRY